MRFHVLKFSFQREKERLLSQYETVGLFLLCCALLLFVPGMLRTADASQPGQITINEPLPPFMLPQHGELLNYVALRDYCGEPRDVRPNDPRRTVVLSFFAHWCEPCKREIPAIEDISEAWGDDVQIFLIAVGDRKDDINGWLVENPTDFPILLDPHQATSRDRYGISSLPTTVVLDSSGIVRYLHTGYTEGDEWELDAIVRVTAGLPQPAGSTADSLEWMDDAP